MNTQNSPQGSQEEASQEETSQEEASQEDQSSPRPARGKQFLPTHGKLPNPGELEIPNVHPFAAPTPLGRLRKAKKRPSTWTKEVAGLYLDANFSDFF